MTLTEAMQRAFQDYGAAGLSLGLLQPCGNHGRRTTQRRGMGTDACPGLEGGGTSVGRIGVGVVRVLGVITSASRRPGITSGVIEGCVDLL